MARPEQEVAEELSRLNCQVDEQQLKALAQALTTGEAVLDAVAGGCEMGWIALVVTEREIIEVGHRAPLLWGEGDTWVTRLYWPDVANLVRYPTWIMVEGYKSFSKVFVPHRERDCPSEEFEGFVQRLQDRVAAAKASSQSGVTQGGDALLAQLERLANLRERGHISDEEFELAKKRLLEQ